MTHPEPANRAEAGTQTHTATPAPATAVEANPNSPDPAVWRTVWTVMVGALAVLFDTTIVAVALHTLADDLHASVATIQWVASGYLLALAVVVPITGWAQRRFGGKRLWIAGLAVFLVGSIASSLAPNAAALIAFRVLQGLGGGVLMPLMATLVMQAAGGRGIGRIMSVVSLPAILGPVAGPVVGGLILDHAHWSWMFWINVPFCLVGIVLAVRFLPADRPQGRARLDVMGVALMAPSLALILFGLTRTAGPGGFGRADAVIPLIVGVLLLVVFAVRGLRRRGATLINLHLLRHRPLASATTLLFLAGVTLYGAMLVIPLYFQQLRGESVLVTGLLLIPQGVGTLASRITAGKLSDTMGARVLVLVGFAITLVGTLPFAVAGAHTSLTWLMVVLFVRGIGLGVVTIPLMALGFRGLTHRDIPDASIVTRIAQQVGGSFGAAILTIVLAAAAGGGGDPAAAFHGSFWWAIGFTALGMVLSLLLPGAAVESDAAAPGAEPSAETRTIAEPAADTRV